MFLVYIWSFIVILLGTHTEVRRVVADRNNVYFWGQNDAATTHRSTGVAKHAERKHASNEETHSNRRLFGRHVCTQNKMNMVPVKDVQTYCKPAYQSYLRRCDKDNSKYCSGYRVVYELAYRTVQRLIAKTESFPACCPGWKQAKPTSSDCKKAICKEECRNGGACTKPDHCSCPPGWTGKVCETDVNECSKKKDLCEQDCINTPGSYRCTCRTGYTLQEDGQSCKRIERNEKINIDENLTKKMDELLQRIDALEDWQRRLASDGDKEDHRHQRDDRINSLSEQIAILEEKLADCSCNRKDELFLPHTQK